ncbi:MAG: hypothetical protein EZS26_000317 [Candidatus Ordinivivax streblomastigis]|uniref:Uncharacterized protein n=1 Tax=Candidatus Ordinivivax streblomastigis TaxID=2540710 RepID=A0A5M8P667_9BACT|nr:MAG: hypothetical protein EZS26_000317 [Candidatus Ordinivivax streblomastigis]
MTIIFLVLTGNTVILRKFNQIGLVTTGFMLKREINLPNLFLKNSALCVSDIKAESCLSTKTAFRAFKLD